MAMTYPRWFLLVLLVGVVAPGAAFAEVPVPNLYVTPTIWAWRWDADVAFGFEVPDRTQPMFGLRVGYTPVDAFAGELVLLTGTNDLLHSETDQTVGMRLTQIEASLVVNFQSLVSPRFYPFLCLGLGACIQSASDDAPDADLGGTHLCFHLGGGLKWELSDRLALRGTFRDTFFSQSQGSGNQETQVTVDSVELSLGLDIRFPIGQSSRRGLQ